VSVMRHMLSVLLLPFMAVVVLPYWLLGAFTAVDTRWISGAVLTSVTHAAGALLFLVGLALFTWCVTLFARVGEGTLAPWDPTRRLVAVGPYSYLRNPMISGVATMLVGEALFSGSRVLAAWAVSFGFVNHIYFLLSEEPGLERRFGSDYRKSLNLCAMKRRSGSWVASLSALS